MKTILSLMFCCCVFSIALSQTTGRELADEMYSLGNYVQALDEYLKIDKGTPDPQIKKNIADCYLKLRGNKAKALPYLEYCYNQGKYKNELLLQFGMAHQYANNLKQALEFYSKYIEKASPKEGAIAKHYIETCENAIELMKKPVNVTFENLGKEVNTKFADYYPFVTDDQGTLFFTSRRDENTGKLRGYLGYYTSDIYFSKVKNGEWTKAKKMPPTINTAEDEQCVGISPDGKNIIIYMENMENPGDLIHAEVQKAKTFDRPVLFNPPVNTDVSEFEGCYGTNSDVLYFTSNRKGGFGESDIYVTKRLPNGEWGVPQNLGSTINTPYGESFPVISADGQYLYFSSQGHSSMGGYDVFKSKWNEAQQHWDPPVNIGYPVNTTDDDMMFSLAGNDRDGYISAVRKEGFGDLDIYKITFNDAEKPLTVLVGYVAMQDSLMKIKEATITLTDLKSNNVIEAKNINPATGKYIFIVEPGKYRVDIENNGTPPFSEIINVLDKSDFSTELFKNFRLPVGK